MRAPRDEGDNMTTDLQLAVDLQRVLCAVNRAVFKLDSGGHWTAQARGSTGLVLAAHQVAELRKLGLVDIVSSSVLVPTEAGRQSYRACAALGHDRHLER
jgi:hypothetical protein